MKKRGAFWRGCGGERLWVWPGEATLLILPVQVCLSSGGVVICFKKPLHPEGGCQVGVLKAFVSPNLAVPKLCGITAARTWRRLFAHALSSGFLTVP